MTEISKVHAITVGSLSLPVGSAAMSPSMTDIDSLSETVINLQLNPFFSKLLWSWNFFTEIEM